MKQIRMVLQLSSYLTLQGGVMSYIFAPFIDWLSIVRRVVKYLYHDWSEHKNGSLSIIE